jgi:IrrE N-terminal-like domain
MSGVVGLARDWLERRYSPGTAEDILERLAGDLWAQEEAGSPVAHDDLASLLLSWAKNRGIAEFARARLNQLMYVVPDGDGFRLHCRMNPSDGRPFKDELRKKLQLTAQYRWVFAHELGHTFFYDFPDGRAKKPYRIRDPEEEQLCNRFASALLMPRAALVARSRRIHTITLEWLLATAQVFGVSVLELARRLILELGILQLPFAIIQPRPLASGAQLRPGELRTRKVPTRVVSPPGIGKLITEQDVLSSRAVERSFLTGLPCISEEFYQPCAASYFVEAEVLRSRPKGGIACMFHAMRPVRRQKTLFDFVNERTKGDGSHLSDSTAP